MTISKKQEPYFVGVEICLGVPLNPIVRFEFLQEYHVRVQRSICDNGYVLKPHRIGCRLKYASVSWNMDEYTTTNFQMFYSIEELSVDITSRPSVCWLGVNNVYIPHTRSAHPLR